MSCAYAMTCVPPPMPRRPAALAKCSAAGRVNANGDAGSDSTLVQEYVNGSLPYSAFASQWQSLLTSSAQAWATQNHVDLNKY